MQFTYLIDQQCSQKIKIVINNDPEPFRPIKFYISTGGSSFYESKFPSLSREMALELAKILFQGAMTLPKYPEFNEYPGKVLN